MCSGPFLGTDTKCQRTARGIKLNALSLQNQVAAFRLPAGKAIWPVPSQPRHHWGECCMVGAAGIVGTLDWLRQGKSGSGSRAKARPSAESSLWGPAAAPSPTISFQEWEQEPSAGWLHCSLVLMRLAMQTEIQLPKLFYHVNIREQFTPVQTLSMHTGSGHSMNKSLHL